MLISRPQWRAVLRARAASALHSGGSKKERTREDVAIVLRMMASMLRDLEAINALNIALQKFEGTVLLVTHDEDLIDEVDSADLVVMVATAGESAQAASIIGEA